MQKAFKYRLYPSKAQETKLERTLDLCRELYNAAITERRGAYQIARKAISYSIRRTSCRRLKKYVLS